MDVLLNQIFSFLTGQPGNVFYHYALVLSIGIALYSAFNNWRSSEFPQARRTMLGLALLLLAQFLLFGFSALGWEGVIDPAVSLPPLDRAFTLLSIVIITWLWTFPEPRRLADWATILLAVLIALAAALSLFTWTPQSTLISYNLTWDELFWQAASLLLLVLGVVILAIRRPNGFWSGLTFLGLALLGHIGHLLTLSEGNYSGLLRLAYLAAFPILVTLPQRFPAPARTQEIPATPRQTTDADEAPAPEHKPYSTDPKTFHAMLALAAESNPAQVSQALTRAIAQTMLADLSFLMYLTGDKEHLVIAGGYDLIREEKLEGGSISKSAVPLLATTIHRGRPLRLPASSTSEDMKGLGELLGMVNPGHLLSVPIVTAEKEVLGGVMLLSPYSNRMWNAEDQSFLASIASSLVPIIQRSQKFSRIEHQAEQTRQALEAASARIIELEEVNQELGKQWSPPGQDIASLLAARDESQKIIAQLQQENADLRLHTNGKGTEQLETELRASLEQMAHLQNQLQDANLKMLELEKQAPAVRKPGEQAEVIASISQELRQPMSSIVGYADLLLGESVGILGAMQRKFVERIKASTERIGSLIDDMIQLNTLETGVQELKSETIDLNMIIDSAMTYTSSQVREKNIAMHLDLPKKLPHIHADREALQQILVHLLQNAGAATPVEGTIRLKVEISSEDGQDYLLIQVSDMGGGIPPEDLPRVFSRLYRADNVLIQGVGDTGVGLSIAKTLTEAQHGRIWVETQTGIGSTFSVLLPFTQHDEPQEHPAAEKGKK